MDFKRSKSRRRKHIKLTGERQFDLYPLALQFYKVPPLDTISLEEFERFALERLQVLRTIERMGTKFMRNSKEYKEQVIAELRKQGLSAYIKITVDENNMTDKIYDERRQDHISHFILRLAYCRSEELRRWFITQEVDLFRIRFTSETVINRKKIMELNNLDYKPIDEEEKDHIITKLIESGYNMTREKVESTPYYRVPFIEALDLVRNRRVYLRAGYAYLPENDLVSIVVTVYRSHLSHALAVTSRALPQLEEDGRLLNMLNTIHQRYTGRDYGNKRSQNSGEVSPEMLDSLSKTSFPLCMRTLHETVRKNHHLKHGGRMQYGLFLKAIGMTLEDSLRFWREEFTKIIDVDKFDKQYAYNIRHNYGKEGKRANYTPYSCMKIIVSNTPGPGDSHGCPFKHCDSGTLKLKLQNLNINTNGITDIMDLVGKGHYQLACTRYFELTHNEATVDQAISHPNQYFEESQKVKSGGGRKTDLSSSQVTTSRSLMYNTNEQSSQNTAASSNDLDQPMDDGFSLEEIEMLLNEGNH